MKRNWVLICIALITSLATAGSALAASSQKFWAQGSKSFGAKIVEPAGGEAALTQFSNGYVKARDLSSQGDLNYQTSNGQKPTKDEGWYVLNVGADPIDITLTGTKFRVEGNATFTASLRVAGYASFLGTLSGSGVYGMGDNGSGEPLIKLNYSTSRIKRGKIITKETTVKDWEHVVGDFNTVGRELNFSGQQFGNARIEDRSTTQDMKVSCRGRGAKSEQQSDQGRRVVVCRGTRGRAVVSGSNVHFTASAEGLKVKFPEGVAGHLRARKGAAKNAFFSPPGV